MILRVRNDFKVFELRDLLSLIFYTLEAMFTTTEQN